MTVGGPRRGFALLTVLWLLSAAAAIGTVMHLAAQAAIAGAQANTDWHRAAWRAEGCAAALIAHLDQQLGEQSQSHDIWRHLNRAGETLPVAGCTVTLEPLGTRANVNRLSTEAIATLLQSTGVAARRSVELAAALADWRDADDEVLSRGAEREWYAAERRPLPRNGALHDEGELRLVRGFEKDGFSGIITAEEARISLGHASPAVLATLPGFGSEVVKIVTDARAAGAYEKLELQTLAGLVSGTAQQELLAAFDSLAMLTAATPDAWDAVVGVSEGMPPLHLELRVRYRLAGSRLAVVQQRFGP
jgi:type II secretory pathway component PulK